MSKSKSKPEKMKKGKANCGSRSDRDGKFGDSHHSWKRESTSSRASNPVKRNFSGDKKERDVNNAQINEPEWYIPEESIAKDTASIPFAVYNGVTYTNMTERPYDENPLSNYETAQKTTIPGVAVYKYIPCWGPSTSGSSALNLAVRAIYTYVRRANAGAKNYESTDLACYILTMDQIYLMVHEAKRLLKLAITYRYQNRDVPFKIARAIGYDLNEIVGNIANFRARLNTIIMKVNTLAVPSSFTLFKRRAILGDVILSDDSDRTSQIIVPESDGYFIYDAMSIQTGTAMTYISKGDILQYSRGNSKSGVPIAVPGATAKFIDTVLNKTANTSYTTSFSYDDLLKFIEGQVGRIYLDEDINIMSGDILKAYNESGLFKLVMIEENETIEVSHDRDLLEQFKNSTVLDVPGATICTASTYGKWANNTEWVQEDSEMSGASGWFSPLIFATATPSQLPKNMGNTWSATPIVTQRDGILIFQAVIPRMNAKALNSKGTNTFEFTGIWSERLSAWASVFSTIPTTSNLILDTYNNDPDYKQVMEVTRLMMSKKYFNIVFSTVSSNDIVETITTFVPSKQGQLGLKNQFVKLYSHPTDNGWTPANNPAHPSMMKATYQIVHGTEIGLGWIVQVPEHIAMARVGINGGSGEVVLSQEQAANGSVCVQWFQFSSDNESFSEGLKWGQNTDTYNTNVFCDVSDLDSTYQQAVVKKTNLLEADLMMQGLDFGPRKYKILNNSVYITQVADNHNAYNVLVTLPGGKFGNKTALVSPDVLSNIHDTAILGLIARDAFSSISK